MHQEVHVDLTKTSVELCGQETELYWLIAGDWEDCGGGAGGICEGLGCVEEVIDVLGSRMLADDYIKERRQSSIPQYLTAIERWMLELRSGAC